MIGRLFRKLVSPKTESPQEVPDTPIDISAAERKQRLAKAGDALGAGNYALAQTLVLPLIQANKDDADALAIEGFRCYLTNDYANAVLILKRASDLGATDSRVLEFLAGGLACLGQDEAAYVVAEKALASSGQGMQVMNVLGSLYMNLEHFDKAAEILNKALIAAPKDFRPLYNLCVLDFRARVHLRCSPFNGKTERIRHQVLKRLLVARTQKNFEEMDARLLLALTSNDPEHFSVAKAEAERLYSLPLIADETADQLANVFFRLGDVARTVEMREQAVGLDDYVKGKALSLGQALIAAGDQRWFAAWEMVDQGFLRFYKSGVGRGLPLWNGERLGSGALFVSQDQGFGDLLLGLRLVKRLTEQGVKVVFWIRPKMDALMENVDGLGTVIASADQPDLSDYNCKATTPLFSLVRLLKLKPRDLKLPVWIKAPRGRCESWRDIMRKELRVRVGVAATGNPWRADDWYRSVSCKDLMPLKALENVAWVNLSVDQREDRDELVSSFGMYDPAPDLHDFADTAALIDSLDIVVAIDCSVAHLAAALGKPVLVLVPSSIDWRWQIGTDTQPWWPNAKSFRSPAPGEWSEPVAKLCDELTQFVAQHKG